MSTGRRASMGSGAIGLANDDAFRAGGGAGDLGVVWFDAHADFDDPEESDPGRFKQAVTTLQQRVSRVYLHVDLDSIDVTEARANKYAAPGGPTLARLLDCIRLTTERLTVAGAAITAYDPAFDPDDRTLAVARAVARQIAGGIRPQPTSATG